jgi:hypothetical protein
MTISFLHRNIVAQVFSWGLRETKVRSCLAILIFSMSAGAAFGQTPPCTLAYNDSDLFLGFRATDLPSDYLVNIGQPTPFVNAKSVSARSAVINRRSLGRAERENLQDRYTAVTRLSH